jgi:hypothetical protein
MNKAASICIAKLLLTCEISIVLSSLVSTYET